MKTLAIGKVAQQVGLQIETIRFYEKRGLIEDPPRSPSGYRRYPEEIVDRLRFIVSAKQLGFSLAEIEDLLKISGQSDPTCSEVETRLQEQIAAVEERIRALQRVSQTLTELVQQCHKKASGTGCPVVEAWLRRTE